MNIYVGNLSEKIDEDNFRQIFEEFGEVTSAKIIIDKYSGRSRGFGFVEMTDNDEATRAIEELNGAEFFGKNLVVNESKPKREFKPRQGGGFNRGGGDFRRRSY